jgi:hypothetical protein
MVGASLRPRRAPSCPPCARFATGQVTLISVVLSPRIAADAAQAGLAALASDDATAAARAVEAARCGVEAGEGASSAADAAAPGQVDLAQPVSAAQTRAAAVVAMAAAAARAKLMADEQAEEMEAAARRVLQAQLRRVAIKLRYLEQVDQVGWAGGSRARGAPMLPSAHTLGGTQGPVPNCGAPSWQRHAPIRIRTHNARHTHTHTRTQTHKHAQTHGS